MTAPDSSESSEKKKFSLSEGMLLGAIPVAVYAMGYSYESGFLSFYGIPTSLISIDAAAMVSSALFGAIYAFALLLWVSLSVDSSASDSYVEKSLGLIMLYFGFFPVLFMLLQGSKYLTVAMGMSFGMMLLIVLLRKLETKWNWLRRVSIKLHMTLSGNFNSANEEFPSAVNALRKGGAIVLIAMIPFLLAYIAGQNNAKALTLYNIISNELGELAVIRIYGDKIIAIPFDRKAQTFSREFVIFEIGSISMVIFKSEKVGPIKYTSS